MQCLVQARQIHCASLVFPCSSLSVQQRLSKLFMHVTCVSNVCLQRMQRRSEYAENVKTMLPLTLEVTPMPIQQIGHNQVIIPCISCDVLKVVCLQCSKVNTAQKTSSQMHETELWRVTICCDVLTAHGLKTACLLALLRYPALQVC